MKDLGAGVRGLTCILAMVLASTSFAKIKYHRAVIEKNVDGDTVWARTKGIAAAPSPEGRNETPANRLKVRMLGMDTPETHLPTIDHGVVGQGVWGQKATEALIDLIPVGTQVTIEDQGTDKYGRVLGRIFIGDDDIDLAMVRNGWAATYIICSAELCDREFVERERVRDYVEACEEAEASGRGIYNPKAPLKELPFEFRLRMSNREPDKYVADYYTNVLYAPADYKEVDVCSRIFFMSKKDAHNAGFFEKLD